MGYDLHGLGAKSSKGEYFRNNVWWWRPLAEFVTDRCAVSDPQGWFHNGGHEVSEDEARQIAETLKDLIALGEVKDYERRYTEYLQNMPDEECDICHGAGVRNDRIIRGTCNGCNGKGTMRPFRTNYPFSEENVREFADFCEQSGGFSIN
jgi:DnaJ-class molecular chaperone